MLPEGVHKVMSHGKAFYYWRPGRGKANPDKSTWRRLPGDPTSAAFWQAIDRLSAKQLDRQTVDQGGMAKMIAAYVASPHYTQDLSPATRKEYGRYMKFATEKFGALEPDDLEPRHIAELRDGWGKTPAAANAMIRAIQALYKWGRERGLAKANPADKISKLKIGEYEPWPQWAWNLVQYMRPELRLACTLALYTGQRLGDLLEMHMGQIRDGTITVRQAKTGKTLRIPLHRELGPVLEECRKRGALYLISRADGSQFTMDAFQNLWSRDAAAVKIRRAGFVFHGLRKSAAVKLAEAGCTEKEIAAITGQSMQMVEKYSKGANQLHLARQAMKKVEQA